jgi:ubiquinone/menaquinone biosynthesis C-methylase UbiE
VSTVLRHEIAAAYAQSAVAWADRPAEVYRRLASALLDRAGDLRGLSALDIGGGTGVAATEALRRGARYAVTTDVAAGMLARRDPLLPAVLADAQVLPFRAGRFDVAILNFVLGHLDSPQVALAEARRVAGGTVASAFDRSWSHPAKALVDEVMAGFGFEVPPWYRAIKAHEDAVADPVRLRRAAELAGFEQVDLVLVDVRTGLDGPEEMVAWRWGMAHLAPFATTLDPRRRVEARAACLDAVAGLEPVVVPMLALSAR